MTGRKIIVDSYGGMGRHGGGAFSGKDPTKVDRSAAYMGRWVAKNIVAARLAAKCEIQFAYAIGHPDPVSVHVDTFGTATVPESKIIRAVNRVFSFQPADIIEQLNLRRPIYSKTTNYGHFGKNDPDLTWEKTDKVAALKKALITSRSRFNASRIMATIKLSPSARQSPPKPTATARQTRITTSATSRSPSGAARPSRSPSTKCPASWPSAPNTARKSRSRACASPARCT